MAELRSELTEQVNRWRRNLKNLKKTPLGRLLGSLVHDHETALYHFGTAHAE